jgi:hypothetical protein
VHLDLPHKVDVYYVYANDMIGMGYCLGTDVVKPKAFYDLWKREFKWLKVLRRTSVKHSCFTCEDLAVSTHSSI